MTDNNTRTIALGKSGKFALVDAEDFEWLNRWSWQYTNAGYANRVTGGPRSIHKKYVNVAMHKAIVNCPLNLAVDHVNGNKLDNRKSNLRICTQSQNNGNRSISTRNKSGFKGVSWQERSKKWLSLIVVNGKRKEIGLFNSALDAAKAYNAYAYKIHGESAVLNKIP